MTTETGHGDEVLTGYHPWVAALVAGLLAGTGMGVVLSVGTDLMPAIGAVYRMPSFLGGWVAHLANSVLFAAVFAAILSRSVVRRERFTLATYVALGIGYGAFLGLFTGGVLIPIWLSATVDSALPSAFPFDADPGVGFWVSVVFFAVSHLVYGAVLGPTYAVLSRSIAVPGDPFRDH